MSSDWAVRPPHLALRHLITRYIGYAQRDVSLGIHRGLPSQHVTVIISLRDPVRVVGMPRPDDAPITGHGLVGGMHVGPALIAQDQRQSGIHLELNPLGVRTLLGVSAGELSGTVVGLGDIGDGQLARLPERLAEVSGWSRRFAILDETFASRLADRTRATPVLGRAWQRILGAGGQVRVQSLADDLGWSRRHLGAAFRRELGLSPKQAARVVRFDRACAALQGSAHVDLAELAVRCGYYDQAHLTNEWRALAGCSPGTWIAEELPFLQYEAAADDPPSGHD